MTTITLIAGGYSEASRLTALIQKADAYCHPRHINFQVVQVHQLNAEALITADFKHPDIVAAHLLVEQSAAVIVVTPTFKASYSGILKTFLDLLPSRILKGKPVLPLALGGSKGHLLMLKYALEPILSELGAEFIAHGTYITDDQVTKDFNNNYHINEEATSRIESSLTSLLNQVSQQQTILVN
ncbi:NAD(P)H-dependent oxidoreductase [Brochothrix thermosphacta]|uniref:Putative FMN reductase NADPH-dependent n=1 Tax=Brochothrix thermosphacta TaxID=2756 RepID=A0A2X0QLH5_BROTH|nr:NAD(P)H-dependent oxidoreductase [Brochothrix thermosphacta]SPP29509.1 putative FMN reductase NADPH-dependent [Brochothrix thermosphacta]